MIRALDALRTVTLGTPYEGRLWLVGGAVRDELLGLPAPTDLDVVTDLDALELARLVHESGASGPPVVYPRFGTAMVRFPEANLELVTARSESYGRESRKPWVRPATLEEDARRRDFTLNAILQNVHTGQVADPLGVGLSDLQDRVLRTPLDPAATFDDDPLRMLRAVRFRRRFGLTPAEGLLDAVKACSDRLAIVSAERVRDEFVRMLELPNAALCLQDLLDLDLLRFVVPELADAVGVEQGDHHHCDVWGHTLLVLSATDPRDLTLRLAALFHDVAKPRTRTVEADGRVRFFGHETLGAEIARERLRALRFATDQVDEVALLVRNHMRLGSSPRFTDTVARRLIRAMGENLDRLFRLVRADIAGHAPGVPMVDVDAIEAIVARVRRETPMETLDSPLSGEQIMSALGLAPGPTVGAAKAHLSELVIRGELSPLDQAKARRLLDAWAKRRAGNRHPK
ncbi:MAG: HD domain-containing protein [Fimbriimonadaceae bacterium]|nr:HD domain-containing protein [Fimbriimonadaceae bacterium]